MDKVATSSQETAYLCQGKSRLDPEAVSWWDSKSRLPP